MGLGESLAALLFGLDIPPGTGHTMHEASRHNMAGRQAASNSNSSGWALWDGRNWRPQNSPGHEQVNADSWAKGANTQSDLGW